MNIALHSAYGLMELLIAAFVGGTVSAFIFLLIRQIYLIPLVVSAPHFTGGGVVLPPTPREYTFKMNKKERRLALKSALTSRVQENKLIVLDELKFDAIKTKNMTAVLNALNVKKALVVINENDQNVVLSARNIADVKTALTNTINVYDILKYNTVVVTKAAVETIEEVYA